MYVFAENDTENNKRSDIFRHAKTHTDITYSLCLLRVVVVLRTKCLFLYGPFCHVALKLDLLTLFATCFL